MFKDSYKSLYITTGDIPLEFSMSRKHINVDIEGLVKLLVRKLQVSEPVINEVIAKIFNSTGESLFVINNTDNTETILTELIRVIKLNCRPYIIESKFSDMGYPVINFNDFYSLDDIIASYTFTSWMSIPGGKPYFDLRPLFDKLIAKNLVEKDEVGDISSRLIEAAQKDPDWKKITLVDSIQEYSRGASRIIAKYVNMFIIDRWLFIYQFNLIDDVSTPYIEKDDDDTYDFTNELGATKLATLMLVLGYKLDGKDFGDEESNITKVLTKIFKHLEDNPSLHHELIVNARIANALLINSIHGRTDAEDFDPTFLAIMEYNQLEVEQIMLDVAVSLIDTERIIETAITEIGCPREFVYDDIVEFIDPLAKEFSSKLSTLKNDPYAMLDFTTNKITNKIEELKAYYIYKQNQDKVT